MKLESKFPLLFKTLEGIVIFFVFALVNINSFVLFRQFPDVENYSGHERAYIFYRSCYSYSHHISFMETSVACDVSRGMEKQKVINPVSRIRIGFAILDRLLSGNCL